MVEEVLKLSDLTQVRKRPFLVTLLAVVVLSITIINLVRFVNTLRLWNFLASFPGISPPVLAITGLFWVIIGTLLFWGLWTGKSSTPQATRVLTVVYLGYQWLERILSVRAGNDLENWPFAVSMTLIVLIFIFWTLSRSGAKTFFGEMHEPSK